MGVSRANRGWEREMCDTGTLTGTNRESTRGARNAPRALRRDDSPRYLYIQTIDHSSTSANLRLRFQKDTCDATSSSASRRTAGAYAARCAAISSHVPSPARGRTPPPRRRPRPRAVSRRVPRGAKNPRRGAPPGAQPFLHPAEQLRLVDPRRVRGAIIPRGFEPGFVSLLLTVPHLLRGGGDDGDGEAHDVRSTDAPDAVHVILRFFRKRRVDDVR